MSAKRLHLISSAFKLFYQKGIHAVGINEILLESGVAKKTLYHHFDSKEALVAATLEYRDQSFIRWLKERLNDAAPGSEKIDALFDALDDWFNNRTKRLLPFHGCFFINVSGEFGDASHPLHRQCSQHKQNVAELIEKQVQSLDIDTAQIETITDALCLLKEGAITQAHVQGDRNAAVKAKAIAQQLIKAVP